MLEKILSMAGGKAEDAPKGGVKILGIRKVGENGGSFKGLFDVELPGGIRVRNFVIQKSFLRGETIISSPYMKTMDAETGDVHITRLVQLPAGLMTEVRIQALSAWLEIGGSH
jgi:hypothetical protein